ncbi:hypothetical protein JK359_09865 [Streptomyces actinomycinicus]|uniref:Uncharacterized protein n=1 Tax=Streptomyces actinomycinicus TaxID=1695166 RepID=A0A937JLC7_9ACTN|nr:hypothetical protein [Streptomyces actinomycinicus]MBL1082285.1 hypothetical protein [Streptomyces actinomycinicus]
MSRDIRTMRVAVRAAGIGSGSAPDTKEPCHSSRSTDLVALARDAARARPAGEERPTDVVALATALARVSRPRSAARVVRLLPAGDERGRAWLAVIRRTAADGDFDTALSLKDAVGNRPWAAKAVGLLARVRAENGQYEGARSLAESIPYPHDRLQTWAVLAEVAAEAGDPEWAPEFLDRAEQTERVHDAWTLPALPVLIRAAQLAGDHDRALASVARLEGIARSESAAREALRGGRTGDRQEKGTLSDTPALVPLLQASIGLGEYERVDALLKRVRERADRAKATAATVRALAQCGEVGRAERLARSVKHPGHRAAALASVADAAAAAGDRETIAALGESLAGADEMVHAGPVIAVAEAWAAVGAADRAEAWTRSIAVPALRVEAQAAVAEALAGAGDLERAEAFALRLGDPDLRAEALHRVVTCLAEGGLTARAEDLAGRIQGASRRARALAVVASHAGETDARRLAAPALAVGDWPAVIEVLARVDPSAVAAVAEESLRRAAEHPLE